MRRLGKGVFFLAALSCLALALNGCKQQAEDTKDENLNILRISTAGDPQSLDPRLARDLMSSTFLHMFFDGLMRFDPHGNLVPAIATNIHISEDLKTFTFTLRDAAWSNGDPVEAQDFIETWKMMLSPHFPAPNAYQLFVIKGAQAAKEGKGSIHDVGLQAPDDHTLVVELERSTPYFLELTAAPFYFPVHSSIRSSSQDIANLPWVGNGPFVLQEWQHQHAITAVKNSHYWDADAVHLDKIVALVIEENTALQLFETGQLEWSGSPLSMIPSDAISTLKQQHLLQVSPGAATFWLRANTSKAPLDNVKIRKALSLAIDRQALVDHVLQGGQLPALGIIPPSLKLQTASYFVDHDTPRAWYLFQEGLKELKLSKDELPSITLCFMNSDRNHKVAQALQQQWRKAFDIDVKLEHCEHQVLFSKVSKQDYSLAMGSWVADYRDPINFLDVFKEKTTPTNNTLWSNPQYTELLNLSALETNHDERAKVLRNAERLILDEMPIIPLYYSSFTYVKSPRLKNVYFSDLGFLDFKHTTIGDGSSDMVD